MKSHLCSSVEIYIKEKPFLTASKPQNSFKIYIKAGLNTALETTLTLKLKYRPLIIEAPKFDESSELQTPTAN